MDDDMTDDDLTGLGPAAGDEDSRDPGVPDRDDPDGLAPLREPGVGLVEDFGDAEVVETQSGEDGDEDLLYDCTTWAGESRGLLASLLDSHAIPHAWQGTVLSVHPEDEGDVDALIDEVMASARPALDAAAAKVVYEVGAWPAALQTMLAESLTVADLPYEWDHAGDLVIYAEHEDEVEAILDEMPDPDDPDLVGDVSANDGIAVHELLDRLFLAAGKLASRDDAASVLAVDDAVGTLERMGPPFGFEPPQWRHLVGRATVLRDALAAGPDAAAALADDELRLAAGELRDLVRRYV